MASTESAVLHSGHPLPDHAPHNGEQSASASTPSLASPTSSASSVPLSFPVPPSFPSSSVLLKQGAEGRVFLSEFLSRRCVVKQRFVKRYRHPSLDASLSRARLTAESRSLVKVRRAGVDAPCVLYVSDEERLLVLEYIDGLTMREWMSAHEAERGSGDEAARMMMAAIGRTVAAVHSAGVVHGDLTTSNIMLRKDGRSDQDGVPQLVTPRAHTAPVSALPRPTDRIACAVPLLQTMIDFGLSSNSTLVEDRAVDLYVLERAFISTHPHSQDKFEVVLNAYLTALKDGSKVLQKLHHVRQRGRKRQMVG